MEKRTIIDRIEIEPQTGHVSLRLRKQVIDDDGKTVLASDYHRTTIDASADVAAHMAGVNAHLTGKLSYPEIKTEDAGVLDIALAPLAPLRAAKAQEARDKALEVRREG
jgi:hypothetical protein